MAYIVVDLAYKSLCCVIIITAVVSVLYGGIFLLRITPEGTFVPDQSSIFNDH